MGKDDFLKYIRDYLFSQKMYRNRVYQSLHYLEYVMRQWKWDRHDFKQIRLVLAKLQLSNNRSRGRTRKPSSTIKEIDKSVSIITSITICRKILLVLTWKKYC